MEGGLRNVATCIGEMEEPITIPICGCGVPAHLRTSWSNDILEGGFLAAKTMTVWCISHVDFSVGLSSNASTAKVVLLGLLKRIRANEVQKKREFAGFSS
ncbi:hypothetical protein V6N13_080320 [Hibiscus sabdariffa]|uniref:Uncharacterized protein n=1 Tax=Hibiscus sabdariffa TaxID=183260 RepID=A0ABR2PYM4_9ROSI